MAEFIFVSDLHGRREQYQKLITLISKEKPAGVFIGGDILPGGSLLNPSINGISEDFVKCYLIPEFHKLKQQLQDSYPQVYIIMGNDDPRFEEVSLLSGAGKDLWHYIHNRHVQFDNYTIFGYSFVPPTPFMLKDWERYDVSRFVDVGAVSPEDGYYSSPVKEHEKRWSTISNDLKILASEHDLNNTIFLFHAPPYQTNLDRADLDGKMVDYTPLDVNIGSIAIKRFIENQQPLITLHGHVHESTRITGQWRDWIGRTHLFSAAHDGPELAVVCFDPEHPETAVRKLI
ncbi:metallophosphoesterase [bacterium]|nr:metallophosphoesterase [bacterium]MBU1064448.1 metallophosphoesterase [bacterium]MBU1635034.1 metallophosphoesterase [bacterium]MBU1872347.1 metallophosphoesterase [bacterium]